MPSPPSDQSTHSPDQSLEEAYRAADYRVNGQLLKIGRPHPEFDRWLSEQQYTTYYLLTAHNPYSTPLPPAVNALRHRTLLRLLDGLGMDYAPASGGDTAGTWTEEGVCLFDVPLRTADQLGKIYEQHAVVHGSRGGQALLRWL